MNSRRSTRHKTTSSKNFIGGGVTEADYKAKQRVLDLSFKTTRSRIERFTNLRLYRELVTDEGISIELERLRAEHKKCRKAATKRAIEDLNFLTA